MHLRLWAGLVGLSLGLASAPASAQSSDFYKDKTIRIVVSFAPGGGYDMIARLLAKHMPKHIPGNPNILVVNVPGAAGIIAANQVFNLAPKDGTTMGMFNRFVVVAPLLGKDEVKFKAEEFNWVGTYASYRDNAYVLWIRRAVPHQNILDLRNPQMPMINLGTGGEDVTPILKDGLGLTNVNIIRGYTGSSDLDLAFERGEVDGQTSGLDNVKAVKSHWITSYSRPFVQFGRGMVRLDVPELKGIPTALELAVTAEDKALVELGEVALTVARPFALPPGVPADRVAILRKAFDDTLADPELIKENTFELSPKGGLEVQRIVSDLTKVPKASIERYKAAIGEGAR
jgi:hypothetical protein